MIGVLMLMAGGCLLVSEKIGAYTWRSKLGVALFYGGAVVAVFGGDW